MTQGSINLTAPHCLVNTDHVVNEEDDVRSHRPASLSEEPSTQELAAIEREWPLIAAELELLDAEISILDNEGRLSELDWRRLRRTEDRVMREAAALASRPTEHRRRGAA